jgi:hypothetical protein
MNKMQKIRIKTRNGYTLLFAVLTATLVLGVAVFILGVSRKQLALSIAARDSMYSLYAADSGIECAAAAYAAGTLATTSDGINLKDASITCKGVPVTSSWDHPNPAPTGWSDLYTTSISMNFDLNNSTCVNIVIKNGYDNTPTKNSLVLIESRGYNYCDTTNTPKVSSRTVERAFRLVYQ